jgi:hypothetical protein
MNVRIGTFRLWVVLSVLFVIALAAFSYSNIHTEFTNAYTDWNAVATKLGGENMVPADCEKQGGPSEQTTTGMTMVFAGTSFRSSDRSIQSTRT